MARPLSGAINRTKTGLLLTGHLDTTVTEILIKTQQTPHKDVELKMSPARQFSPTFLT